MLTPQVLTGGAVAVVLGLAACSSGGGQSEGVRSTGPAQRGGTLHVLDEGTVLSWDPQRVYSSSDMSGRQPAVQPDADDVRPGDYPRPAARPGPRPRP